MIKAQRYIIFGFVLLFSISFISCEKNTDEILSILQDIKQQNSDLKMQVTALQKTADSLSLVLKQTNQGLISLDKKIDSVKSQISILMNNINQLSIQMSQANANIMDLQLKVADLQVKCKQLIDVLQQLLGNNLTKNLTGFVIRLGMTPPYFKVDTATWNYIAIVKTATNAGKVYKNGNLVFNGSFENQNYLYNRLDIGAEDYITYGGFFKGAIDEVRISNRERSANEIFNSFDSNVPFLNDANTIGLWHFDDNVGLTVSSVKGPAGTSVNPKWDFGKFGRCIYYDGITTRTSMNMNIPTSDVTIEFWFKPDGLQDSKTVVSLYGLYTTTFKLSIQP